MSELKAAMQCLQHMLGADSGYNKSQWGFRNSFVCGPCDQRSMDLLVEAGYVRKGICRFYCATKEGCKILGFGKPAMERWLESTPSETPRKQRKIKPKKKNGRPAKEVSPDQISVVRILCNNEQNKLTRVEIAKLCNVTKSQLHRIMNHQIN